MFIQLENIYYKNILKNVSLQFELGNIHGIIGKSGVGKTTLLKILAMITSPESGMYYYEEKNIDIKSDKVRGWYRNHRFGYIDQSYSLIEHMSAYENIIVPYRICKDDVDTEWLQKICMQMQINTLLNQDVSYMSGGERQRVVIARALAKRPQIVFADEPTSALDSENAKEVISILKDINEKYGITIIMATHDDKLRKICDTVYDFEEGGQKEQMLCTEK